MKQGKPGKNRSVVKTIELQLAFHGGAVLAAFLPESSITQ